MQTKIKRGFAAGLMIIMLFSLCVTALSCSASSKIEKIEAEGYRENFFVGDKFELGADFKLWATYKDGTKSEITEGYTIKQEATTDMNVTGSYSVTIEFSGFKYVYWINVNGVDGILQSLSVKEGSVRTVFLLGEEISFDGIRLNASYVYSDGKEVDITYSSIGQFNVAVTDESGEAVSGILDTLGNFYVKISQGMISTVYTVTVEEADLESIGGAVVAGQYGAKFVNSGTVNDISVISGTMTTEYRFLKGDNYTYIYENLPNSVESDRYPMEYHYSLNNKGKLSAVKLENGNMVTSSSLISDVMNGVPILLWWNNDTEYGIEAAITNLWNIAKNNPNGDYKEQIDSASRTYSFSFGYLMQRTTGVSDDGYYFESSVEFKLDENYAIISATLTQILYTHTDDYVKDSETGYVTPPASGKYSNKLTVTAEQTVGERTAVNPYGEDATKLQDFTLQFEGQDISDGDTVKGNAGTTISISITELVPETANFNADRLYYSDGKGTADSTLFSCTGYIVYMKTNSNGQNYLVITLSAGGEWDLVLTTKNVKKTIHLSVTGSVPTNLNTQVYQSSFNSFTENKEVTAVVGAEIYFRAVPNDYANGAYTVDMISQGEGGKITQATLDAGECWMFTATEAGTYVITMTSSVSSKVSCKLTISVVELPNFDNVLTGSYQTSDNTGGIYTLTFTKTSASSDTVSGTVEITYKPKSGDEITQKMKFTISESDLALMLEMNENKDDALGIELKFNASGEFILEDPYGQICKLVRFNDHNINYI